MTKKMQLTSEEEDLLNSFEAGEWRSVENLPQEKKRAKRAAGEFFKKDARINIRLSAFDLRNLKAKAAFEGIPYQTLITSILHKYASRHGGA